MPETKKNIIIIGAGELGVTCTILIHKLVSEGMFPDNFEIHLIEKNDDILEGASLATNINHETGYEYLKTGHLQTGYDCIQGGLTKRLMYDLNQITTNIPNRFLISKQTIDQNIASESQFIQNTKLMREYFESLYLELRLKRNWSDDQAEKETGIHPKNFYRLLNPDDFSEMDNIISGVQSAGGSIKAAYNYAIKKQLLEKTQSSGLAQVHFQSETKSIAKTSNRYLVTTTTGEIEADYIIQCSAHNNPFLQSLTGSLTNGPKGMYHLNGMLYLKLPATKNHTLLNAVRKVNFVIQGQGGGMFACIKEPTSNSSGYAAAYFPSETGSQIKSQLFVDNKLEAIPAHWNDWIKNGLPPEIENERTNKILEQLFTFNPLFRNYVEPIKLLPRTVFNPIVPSNLDGKDRRVRQLVLPSTLTPDELVISSTSPKWTNCDLAALNVIEQLLERVWKKNLPKIHTGFGPNQLDVEFITRKVHFKDETINDNLVERFQKKLNLPSWK